MMADRSYYAIDDFDLDRTPASIRYPDTLDELWRTLIVERQIPDDTEVYLVTRTRLFTVGEFRRETERH